MFQKIAILASGSGTNAENLVRYFQHHPQVRTELILTNNPHAGVLERAGRLQIPAVVFNRKDFCESGHILDILSVQGIDFIILAGFLWLIPLNLLEHFHGRILNIHPALLPRYGGKGMYGRHVHEAVLRNREKESGITIHLVNEIYDAGKILFQATCPVLEEDTPETLAARVHELEYKYFPGVTEKYIRDFQGRE